MKQLFVIKVQFDNNTTPPETIHVEMHDFMRLLCSTLQKLKYSSITYSSLQMTLVLICDICNIANAHEFQGHSRYASVSCWLNIFKDPILHDCCIPSKETGSAIYHLFFLVLSRAPEPSPICPMVPHYVVFKYLFVQLVIIPAVERLKNCRHFEYDETMMMIKLAEKQTCLARHCRP